MSTREKIKHYIDVLPDESINAINEYISSFIVVSVPPQKNENELEKAYQTLQKLIRRVDPPIDDEKELMEYLDERYGPIN
jgi:hypothetical protein